MSEDESSFGGGSGGGATAGIPSGALDDKQDNNRFFDGTYSVTANQLQLTSRAALPPASPDPCAITLLASDITEMNGNINLRGMGGVRITAGPPPLPATGSTSTQGVEIEVGEMQSVTIKRGLIDGIDQTIEMTPSGITIDGGSMPVTIQSLTEIKLSVMGGASSITLGPAGIIIQGLPIVKIN
jgi:hypothetical protein